MKNNFNIFLDTEEDTLNIIKTPSKNPVNTIEGKYGIELKQDINGNTVEYKDVYVKNNKIKLDFSIKSMG